MHLCISSAKLVENNAFPADIEDMIVDRSDDVGEGVHFHLYVAEHHLARLAVAQCPRWVEHLGDTRAEVVIHTAGQPDLSPAPLIDLRDVALVDGVAEGDGKALPLRERESGVDLPRLGVGKPQTERT